MPEVLFLLVYGELPSQEQQTVFDSSLRENYEYDSRLDQFCAAYDQGFYSLSFKQTKAHPMAMMSTLMSVFSSFYPEANPAFKGVNIYNTQKERDVHIHRILGVAPAVAAACYRLYSG